MSRYRSTGQLDDPQVIDGDAHFVGLDQVNEPTMLPEGYYQFGENIRVENGKVVSRGGLNALPLAGSPSTTLLPSKPLDLIKYQNPRSSVLITATMRVPTGSGTAEVKIIARDGGNVIWNNETFTNITGNGIPSSTISVEVSGGVFRYIAPSFPNSLFITNPNLEISVYLVKFTTGQTHESEYFLTTGFDTKFWESESGNDYNGFFYYSQLEGWENHRESISIRNNTIINVDPMFANSIQERDQLNELQLRFSEYNEFRYHRYISGASMVDQYETQDHRFLPSKWSINYRQRRGFPPTHIWEVLENGTQVHEFSVRTNDTRSTGVSGEFVSKLREMYAFIYENTPEYRTGHFEWSYVGSGTEGGSLIPTEATQSQDEDILVIMKNKMSGVFTQQSADINPPYTDESEVSAIQCFDQAILFSRGFRPKTWNGEQSDAVELSNTASTGTDFSCPSAPFGIYINNRLGVPHYEDSKTSVAFSDILDLNGFMNTAVFSANRGTSDITLAMSVFTENQLLIFNRNSIHLLNNMHGENLAKSSAIFEITRQYGVAGQNALAQNGSYHYFISSEGNIQVLVPSSDPAKGIGIAISKVTLDQLPLSKPIQNTIDQIDRDSLPYSIAHYHRNKVYFAFGIDRPYPNTIAVYDSLRNSWISIDKFPFDINIRGMESIKNRLFILTDSHICEYETGDSDIIGSSSFPITSKLKTREYRLGTHSIKKFTRGSISIKETTGGLVKTTINTTNPDTTIPTQHYIVDKDESKINRFNISSRGYSANLEVETETIGGGGFELSNVSLEGYSTSRQTGNFA